MVGNSFMIERGTISEAQRNKKKSINWSYLLFSTIRGQGVLRFF